MPPVPIQTQFPPLFQWPPPPPNPPNGSVAAAPPNRSDIPYHGDRWIRDDGAGNSGPPPYMEIGDRTEESSQTDCKCVRYFLTPWSYYEKFRCWILGWCDSQRDPNDTQPPAPATIAGTLVRRLPDQHPLKTWLYASACDLVEPQGAPVQGRYAVAVTAPPGTPVTLTGPGNQQVQAYAWLSDYAEAAISEGLSKVRVTYTRRPYEIRNDVDTHTDAAKELTRFVERDWEPAVQSLPYYKIAGYGKDVISDAAALDLLIVGMSANAAKAVGATAGDVFNAARAATQDAFARKHPELQAIGNAVLNSGAQNAAGPEAAFTLIANAVDAAIVLLKADMQPKQLVFTEGSFAGQAIPEAGVLLIPTKEVIYRLHEWPDANWSVLDAAMGKINLNAFDGVATGYPKYPAQTLLFLTYKPIRSTNAAGRVQFLIELRMAHRPQGWNRFPAPNGQFYAAAFGDGSTVYQTTDFAALLTLPPPATYWPLAV